MTFDKQVKEAKRKRLENRIIRDVIFILLGITFLIISFVVAYNKENDKNNKVSSLYKNNISYYYI